MLGLDITWNRAQQEKVETHFQRALQCGDGERVLAPFVLAGSNAPAQPQHRPQQQHSVHPEQSLREQDSQPQQGHSALDQPQQQEDTPNAPPLTHAPLGPAPEGEQQLQPQLPRPPLHPDLALFPDADAPPASAPREVPLRPRELVTCHSAASSLGTCSSLCDDEFAPSAAPTPAESRSVSFAASILSGNCTRRVSLLSDSGRASRRDSQGDGSPKGTQQQHPAEDPDAWRAGRWSFGVHSEQNKRTHMEDRVAACDVSEHAAFSAFKRAGFFAVFDGHSGPEAAEYLQQHLLQYLKELTPDELAASPGAALCGAVERAESEILRRFAEASCNAGSTLLAALLLDDRLHVANVGDSRAVLARGTDAIQITTDHKPHDEGEAARIAREHGLFCATPAGCGTPATGGGTPGGGGSFLREGHGEFDGDAPWLVHDHASAGGGASDTPGGSFLRMGEGGELSACGSCSGPVVTSDGYLYGELAVARAIGSQHLKRDPTKRAFTHVPDIHEVQLAKEDDMLLLASDGLWDKVENSQAVLAARRCMARDRDAAAAARALIDRAVKQDSCDNISVVVVCLHDRGISLPKTNSMLFRRLQLQEGGSRPVTPSGGAGSPATGAVGSPLSTSRCMTPC